MFLKLGNSYSATLLVTDINGNRILNDSPIVTIKDIQENKYWNGITWQSSEFNIIMAHIDNGVYSYNINLDKIGVFSVVCKSVDYNIIKNVSLEIYDTDIATYDWLVNTSFVVKYTGTSDNDIVNLKIFKESDKTYWNGTEWVNSETIIQMPLLLNHVYSYSFIPNTEGNYDITIYTDESEIFYIVEANSDSSNIPPVLVSHNTLKSIDGTDSKLLNEQGLALSGVQITVFNPTTKEVICKTVTNANGEWNTMLKPGNYYFMFEKAGYISVGFERSVI